jgi:RimJ/RimL family protein N-acetyltransferase
VYADGATFEGVQDMQNQVLLRRMTMATAEALLADAAPPDVSVAADYPSEFSTAIATQAARGGALGPYCIHRAVDEVVIGEIGGAQVGVDVVEIGYAIVASCWGLGYASDAVSRYIQLARSMASIERLIAHTPFDRPASGRVLEKSGFVFLGATRDEHNGEAIEVKEWQLELRL